MPKQYLHGERECMNCHEVKPIHAHGLCVTCYRADARAQEHAEDTQAASKEQRKKVDTSLTNHTAILRGLSKQGVPQRAIDQIRIIMRPYFVPVDYLFTGLDTAQPEHTDQHQPQQSAEAHKAVNEMIPEPIVPDIHIIDKLPTVPECRIQATIARMLQEEPTPPSEDGDDCGDF